jgi:hypothetical protein
LTGSVQMMVAALGRLEERSHGVVEVVENVVQHVVDPDDVERLLRQGGRVQRSANELRPIRNPVQGGAPLRQFDRTRRDVEARDAGAELREDHAVFALTATEFQDGLARQITQQVEAILLRP